jgi:histidinol-phosphate aminotransferase
MIRSRRDFLRSLGIGVAGGAALQRPIVGIAAASSFEPNRWKRPDGFIRLDSNENAYGPSRKVASAISAATGMVNRYPFRKYEEVTDRISAFHRVKRDQVLFGCGSTEILRVAACVCLGNGRQMIQASPTFEASKDYAKSLGSEVISVPLDRHFAHDLNGMFPRPDRSTGLIYICNPNNPTASITPRKDLETFVGSLPADTHVLVDEAYHHFASQSERYASFIDHPLDDERLIVTRTFSKVYGLAGLRLGYAVASPQVVRKMRSYLTQDSLNAIMAEVVEEALSDTEGVKNAVERNNDDRQEFHNQAMVRMLKPIDSQTNFVMVNTQHPANEVIEHFLKHKILIGRHFPAMDTYIRISLGTPEEMRSFWRAWDLIPWSKRFMQH